VSVGGVNSTNRTKNYGRLEIANASIADRRKEKRKLRPKQGPGLSVLQQKFVRTAISWCVNMHVDAAHGHLMNDQRTSDSPGGKYLDRSTLFIPAIASELKISEQIGVAPLFLVLIV
jgi:hypothetical protein